MRNLMEIDLRIVGPAQTQTRSRTIREGDLVRVGRSPISGIGVPWDRHISREQADLFFDGDQLHVKCLDEARNPILCGKRAYRQVSLVVGDEFRIGDTRFTLCESEASTRDSLDEQFDASVPPDVVESEFSAQQLRRVEGTCAAEHLEILASLPGMIASARNEEELAGLIVPRLLDGIPLAAGAVFARFDNAWLDRTAGPEVLTRPLMIHVETRAGYEGRLRPSRRLILEALRAKKSILHFWGAGEDSRSFTISDGLEWAFCVPFPDDACRGWCFVVAGRLEQVVNSDAEIREGLRFAELLSRFVAATRHVRQAENQQARLKTTFTPAVVTNITGQPTADVPPPAEGEMTALYCDFQTTGAALPGTSPLPAAPPSSVAAPSPAASEDLSELLQLIREMLQVVVGGILDRDGAITDFRDSSALGLWGWPISSAAGPVAACQAALDIARSLSGEFGGNAQLAEGFSIGMGIAHGPAIAGRIGPSNQARFGAYGPAVRRGTLLARAAREFGVAICIDEATASWAQARLKKSAGRIRRLARLRLAQQEVPCDVFGLLPSLVESPLVTDEMIVHHDAALDAIADGEWTAARSMLARLPEGDQPARFLLRKMAETSDVPPAGWDSAFTLS